MPGIPVICGVVGVNEKLAGITTLARNLVASAFGFHPLSARNNLPICALALPIPSAASTDFDDSPHRAQFLATLELPVTFTVNATFTRSVPVVRSNSSRHQLLSRITHVVDRFSPRRLGYARGMSASAPGNRRQVIGGGFGSDRRPGSRHSTGFTRRSALRHPGSVVDHHIPRTDALCA